MTRKIIHIDMDAFYASIEQRDFPQLRGKPVIVGGKPNSRGVVATASYEARMFGVHSAMPSATAYRLCPNAIFVKPRFTVYREVSAMIHQIFHQYSELIEPLSLDEAYIDVSKSQLHHGSATLIAQAIRQDIQSELNLSASAGVSYNKMLAKIASDINKPNGIAIILPEQALEFIATLPIEKFHGVGKATAKIFHEINIHNGLDLRNTERQTLISYFGKRGNFYYDIARGIDERPVCTERMRKSIGSETTFIHDLNDDSDIFQALLIQNQEVWELLQKKELQFHTLSIKLKFSNFIQITRSLSIERPFLKIEETKIVINKLYQSVTRNLPIRLVGVSYSHLHKRRINKQAELF